MVLFYYNNKLRSGLAQDLGLSPYQQTKVPFFIVGGLNFYKIIYIYIYIYLFSKGCTFFLLVMLRIL